MAIQDVWLANLKILVDSEGRGDRRRGYRAVADAAGLSEEYIYQLVEGKPKKDGTAREIGKIAAGKIAAAYQDARPENWFDYPLSATEIGTLRMTGTPAGAMPANGDTMARVWVVGKGQGGLPERLWTDGDHPVGLTDEFAEVHSTDPHAFLVRVEGSSMYPKFEAGNYALVEPSTEPELEDCVLVRLASGETLIKRLLSRRAGYKLGSFSDPAIIELDKDAVTWVYYIAHEVPRRRIKSRH